MKTLFQDYEGIIPELDGRVCEKLFCIQVVDELDQSLKPAVFWLKIANGRWHRFFIDATFYFLSWKETEELDESDFENQEDFPVFDAGARFGLDGLTIEKIEMRQTAETGGRLEITFKNGRRLELVCGSTGSRLLAHYSK